jgi:membrane-associated protease RseP (regulator of RpoE activity)
MTRWRLVRLLLAVSAIAIIGVGIAAGVAATRDSGSDDNDAVDPQDDTSESSAWLGILGDTSEDPAGVRIVRVFDETAAQEAGLESGDVITAIDGDEVVSIEDLRDATREHDPGDKVTLSVIKGADGNASDIEVKLGEQPARFDKIHDFRFDGFGGGILDGIKDLFPDGFDSFLDGSFRYKDDSGDVHEVAAVAGTVTEISDDKITIEANDGDTRSFDMTDYAHIPGGLESGDDVIVVSIDGDAEAVIAPGHFGGIPLPHFDLEGNGLPFCEADGPGQHFDDLMRRLRMYICQSSGD